jgi:hypothetical protein
MALLAALHAIFNKFIIIFDRLKSPPLKEEPISGSAAETVKGHVNKATTTVHIAYVTDINIHST